MALRSSHTVWSAALSLLFAWWCAPWSHAQATVHLVPEEFGTIQAALVTATPGDTVSVGPGEYPTRLTLREGVALVGRGDATSVVIRGFNCQDLTSATRIQNLTIRGGSSPTGGGATLIRSSPAIVRCVFADNRAPIGYSQPGRFYYEGKGGAIYVFGDTARLLIEGYIFSGNVAEGSGGAIYSGGASVTLLGCTFDRNSAPGSLGHWFDGFGGALRLEGGSLTARDCAFTNNSSDGATGGYPYGGGAIAMTGIHAVLTDCVVAWNATYSDYSEGGRGGGIYAWSVGAHIIRCTIAYNYARGQGAGLYLGGGATLESSVIAFNRRNSGIAGGEYTVSCCDVFGNEGGDGWTGNDGGGNFALDPGFCDGQGHLLRLRSDSPCLPGTHPTGSDCGRIGGLGQACTGVPTAATSWGELRARFRPGGSSSAAAASQPRRER